MRYVLLATPHIRIHGPAQNSKSMIQRAGNKPSFSHLSNVMHKWKYAFTGPLCHGNGAKVYRHDKWHSKAVYKAILINTAHET